jgi:serine/threonine protein kinase
MVCPGCGANLDISQARPLSRGTCPGCKHQITIPAKVGSMLITGILGEGTGSVVYRAQDRVLGRDVALKVMKGDDGRAAGWQNGIDEARSLLLINHPNVIKVHAIDTRRGQPCIIMELLTGGSMKDMLEAEALPSEQRVLETALDVCKALAETSRRGLLHLDVKPGNIMFDESGRAKLLDFGFAAVGIDDRPDEIIGTPYYVSPELVRQEIADERADIYSLGATLFHVLSHVPPFDHASLRELILQRLKAPPPDIRKVRADISPRTALCLMKMMHPEKELRYRNYESLITDLECALRNLPAGT